MVNEAVKRTISGACIIFLIVGCTLLGRLTTSLMLFAFLFLMLVEWKQMFAKERQINQNPKLYNCGVLYIAFPVLYWNFLFYRSTEYISQLLLVFIIMWSSDTFAYIGGRLMKGPKLCPKISPKKTWSGAITGVISSLMCSALYLMSIDEKISLISLFCIFIISISGIFGDLLESKMKRMLNVKDSGNIIPGHGGICDRLDSFLMGSYAHALLLLIFKIC